MEQVRQAIGGIIYPGAAKNIENNVEKKQSFLRILRNKNFSTRSLNTSHQKSFKLKTSENSEKGLKIWEDFILNESKSNFTKIIESIQTKKNLPN